MTGGLRDTWTFNFDALTWMSRNTTQNTPFAFTGGSQFTGESHFSSSLFEPSSLCVRFQCTANYRPATDTIVTFGGLPSDPLNVPLNSQFLAELNVTSLQWTRRSVSGSVPLPRYAHVSAVFNDSLYITLGFSDALQVDVPGLSVCELSTGVWTSAAQSGDVPSVRDSMLLVQAPPSSVRVRAQPSSHLSLAVSDCL